MLNQVDYVIGYNSNIFDYNFIKDRWNILHRPENSPILRKATEEGRMLTDSEEILHRAYMYKTMSDFDRLFRDETTHIDVYEDILRQEGIPALSYEDGQRVVRLLNTFANDSNLSATAIKPADVNHSLKELNTQIKKLISLYGDNKNLNAIDNHVNMLLDSYDNYVDSYGLRALTKGDSRFYLEDITNEEMDQLIRISEDGSTATILEEYAAKHGMDKYDARRLFENDTLAYNPQESLVLHRLYDIQTNPDLNYEAFVKDLRAMTGRKQITNLQQLFRNSDGTLQFNYKRMTDPEWKIVIDGRHHNKTYFSVYGGPVADLAEVKTNLTS